MHRLSLVLLFIICAFIPVLIARYRRPMSRRGFWAAWIVALAGAFTGGTGGAFFMSRWGWEMPYLSAVPALFTAGVLLVVYLKIRELPEAW